MSFTTVTSGQTVTAATVGSGDYLTVSSGGTESFVDGGGRAVFHDRAGRSAPPAGRTGAPPLYCAPRVDSGPELDAIRRRLGTVSARTAQAA